MAESPLMPAAEAEDVAEQVLGLLPLEEMGLIGCPLVGVTRRDGDSFNAKFTHVVKELSDFLGLGIVEKRAVDVYSKALGSATFLDRGNRLLEHALSVDGAIMLFL